MSFFIKRPDWYLPEKAATDEHIYIHRREILRQMGFGGLALLMGGLTGCSPAAPEPTKEPTPRVIPHKKFPPITKVPKSDPSKPETNFPPNAQGLSLYPAKRNDAYQVKERGVTDETPAQTFNNYYEFSVDKKEVWKKTTLYDPTPWTLEITGLVKKPQKIDLEKLMKLSGLEERIYRFRCVEAWAMTVPWTGFPLSKLIKLVEPLSSAKYIRLFSANRPKEMPGVPTQTWYPWPYHEGLRMDEAMNELTFMTTGVYGHPLTKQMGAPVRVILPWKYGFKGPKAVTKIEFVAEQPKTFWSILAPKEYGFYANVEPHKAHPRWSQAKERLIPDMKETDTLLYNGYKEQVGKLYNGKEF